SVHRSGHALCRNIIAGHILKQGPGRASCPYSISELCERRHKRMQKGHPFSKIGTGMLAPKAVEQEFTSAVTVILKSEQPESHSRIKGRAQGLFVPANSFLDLLKALRARRQDFKNSSFEESEQRNRIEKAFPDLQQGHLLLDIF